MRFPCVISLVVNGLYNIVDQIFIGNGVGYLGNSATYVVFPLTVLCVALGVLFGDGAATYLSLKLGEGNMWSMCIKRPDEWDGLRYTFHPTRCNVTGYVRNYSVPPQRRQREVYKHFFRTFHPSKV